MDFFYDVFLPYLMVGGIALSVGLILGYYLGTQDEENRQERKNNQKGMN